MQSGTKDDRPLYWARLALRAAARGSDADLALFELASRGAVDAAFPDDGSLRVLLTGFDPFHLDRQLNQSNPSGLAALALDGTVLETARGPATIESLLVPVRFADFDAGLIERLLEPHLLHGRLDLLVTISMGRDAFDLERFPGRRRSSPVTDNLNVLTGARPEAPLIPLLAGKPIAGPEFAEFSLPAAAMIQVEGPWAVRDNRKVRTLEEGELIAEGLTALAGQTAVSGSGGGYLSNEISYRALLLNQRLDTDVPMGHVHVPRVQGFDAELEWRMVAQIRRLVVAALEGLPVQ